jgi:hypothetical protein
MSADFSFYVVGHNVKGCYLLALCSLILHPIRSYTKEAHRSKTVYSCGASSLRQSVPFITATALTITLLKIELDSIEHEALHNT